MLLTWRAISTASLSAALIFSPLKYAIGKTCPVTSSESKLFLLDSDSEPTELVRKSDGMFRLDGDLYTSGRKLRFYGKIRKLDPNDDFMIVIKIRGSSETAKQETTTVRLFRPSMGGRDKGFNSPYFSLESYSKHHFPDENGDVDDSDLKNKFHVPYKVGNKRRLTDDTREKKRLFQFDGVGNKWKGSIFSRIFRSSQVQASPGTKYVYLHAEIRNLRQSPCFDFKTYIPKNVDDLLIQVIPIDLDQRDGLVPADREWPFRKQEQNH